MYDQTINAIYEQALQNDGTNARASATFTPTQAGAPAFPAVLSTGAGATPNTACDGRPRLQGRTLVAEQRAVRAARSAIGMRSASARRT